MIWESVAILSTAALSVAGAYFSYEWFVEQLDLGITDISDEEVVALKQSIADHIESERVAIPVRFSWDISASAKYGALSLTDESGATIRAINFVTSHREEESDEDYRRRTVSSPVRYISEWMERSVDKEGGKP